MNNDCEPEGEKNVSILHGCSFRSFHVGGTANVLTVVVVYSADICLHFFARLFFFTIQLRTIYFLIKNFLSYVI